jgi:hypothetical protein
MAQLVWIGGNALVQHQQNAARLNCLFASEREHAKVLRKGRKMTTNIKYENMKACNKPR